MLWIVIMVCCFAYYAMIVSYAEKTPSFSWFWLAAGIVCGLIYVARQMVKRGIWVRKPPLWLSVSLWTTLGVVVALAILVEVLVISGMFSKADPSHLDYVMVLGTEVNGEEPSKSLQYRLDKAIEYLEEDEELKVIVTGGQVNGAEVSEAYVMARYLLNRGIASERIIMESKAANTRENLIFSYELIDDEEAVVGVITNSFHVYRTNCLADKLGLDNVAMIAAPSDKLLLPTQMVREFFAIVKEKILGYI